MTTAAKISALAPWFGSNRNLAHKVGELLSGCRWVGVPFAGGMCELFHIKAKSLVVGDLHRHLINMARVIADDGLRPRLVSLLDQMTFHPDELDQAQERCKSYEPAQAGPPDLVKALDYFCCVWMGRSHIAGTKDEFHGRLSTRWNANGGDSNVRFRSAVASLEVWGEVARRCSFSVMDAFDFLRRCEDNADNGIYCDPPFYEVGRRYRHNCGMFPSEEREWHTDLRDELARFNLTRVVIRCYDHTVMRELYPEDRWEWRLLTGGKKQSNDDAPEVLLVNRRPT